MPGVKGHKQPPSGIRQSQGFEDPASWGGSGAEGLSPVTHGQLLQLPLPYRDFGVAELCDSAQLSWGRVF